MMLIKIILLFNSFFGVRVVENVIESDNYLARRILFIKKQLNDTVYYTCIIHDEIRAEKPGKCPKCKMILEKKIIKCIDAKNGTKEILRTFTCPLHPEMRTNRPGKCMKCEVELQEKV